MTRPLYIFDLDGTLALIKHRRHFVERAHLDRHARQMQGLRGLPSQLLGVAGLAG